MAWVNLHRVAFSLISCWNLYVFPIGGHGMPGAAVAVVAMLGFLDNLDGYKLAFSNQ